jgi:hypothetical protein
MSGMHIITVAEAADTPAQIQPDSVEDIERLLLTSASAIQRVVAERDALRSRVDTLERELTLLRQQTTLIHDSYRSLTTELSFPKISSGLDSHRKAESSHH